MRAVHAETLDGLDAGDPAARRSRRDLQRIHSCMGTRGILRRALDACVPAGRARGPLRVLELGAGDGTLLLGVARVLAPRWPSVALTLLDRQILLAPETAAGYADLGWCVRAQADDVLAWARRTGDGAGPASAPAQEWDLILANLFLHHFDDAALGPVLAAVARRCGCFLAVEPRRSRRALIASHLVGVLGANAVTREDAVLSVRAGFRGRELGALWGGAAGWNLREYPAGPFSHVFAATRAADGDRARPSAPGNAA